MRASNHREPELEALVDKLEIGEPEKDYLRSRWIDQLVWMDERATLHRRWYHLTRTIVIIGGIIVPAAITTQFFREDDWFHYPTIALSLVVAILAALEGFYHLGEKWRHYRGHSEALKAEGWLFSLKAGPYRAYRTQAEAFPNFTERIEQLLQRDVTEYLAAVAGKGSNEDNPLKVS